MVIRRFTAGHSWVRTPVQAGPGNAFTSAVLKSGGWEQTDLLASQAGISTVQNTCVNSNRASTSLRRQPSVNCTGSKLLLTPVEKLFSECFDERSSLVSYWSSVAVGADITASAPFQHPRRFLKLPGQ